MNSINGLKTCRNGLHQYSINLKQCPDCAKITKRRWSQKNKEKIKTTYKKWYEKNRSKEAEKRRNLSEEKRQRRREISLNWYKRNREKALQNGKLRYENNLEKERERGRRKNKSFKKNKSEYGRQWRKKNAGKIRAYAANRRAIKKQATPLWANQEVINAMYKKAVDLQKITGNSYHVDHIYPLTNPYMCGLHVETNLCILPGKENLKKSNTTWPGQLECQRLPLHLNGFKEITHRQ
jgi:hypothetical protein